MEVHVVVLLVQGDICAVELRPFLQICPGGVKSVEPMKPNLVNDLAHGQRHRAVRRRPHEPSRRRRRRPLRERHAQRVGRPEVVAVPTPLLQVPQCQLGGHTRGDAVVQPRASALERGLAGDAGDLAHPELHPRQLVADRAGDQRKVSTGLHASKMAVFLAHRCAEILQILKVRLQLVAKLHHVKDVLKVDAREFQLRL